MPDEPTLRNTLKVHRAMRSLTQADLAAIAGVTRRSINAIEAGQMVPSVFLALKIARALGVAVDAVFILDDEAQSGKTEIERDPG
jgi:putative transcriptional regulator